MSPSTTSSAGSSASALVAWGRLLRLSLAPTAAADIVAGALFAARGWPGGAAPWLLLGASLCIYHGALALNDWADREHDARTRPERPIPSGAVSAGAALTLALVLLGGGAALSWCASSAAGIVLSTVALLAALYDVAGRGAWSGPLLLGLCRAGNLAAGMSVLGAAWTTESLSLAAGYGAYVFFVSRLGRLEDGEAGAIGRQPCWLLGAAAVCQLVPLVWAPLWPSPLACVGLLVLALRREWSRGDVLAAMGSALRLLLGYSAAVAELGAGSLAAFLLLIAAYPLAWALRQLFPPS